MERRAGLARGGRVDAVDPHDVVGSAVSTDVGSIGGQVATASASSSIPMSAAGPLAAKHLRDSARF